MKDRFLFKAKRVDDSEWIQGTGITDFLNVSPQYKDKLWLWSNYEWIEVIPETVSQCTGLKDKNKTSLFKNDKFKIGDLETLICEWNNGGFGWWQYKGKSYEYFIGFSNHQHLKHILAKMEIIGNIHDEVNNES